MLKLQTGKDNKILRKKSTNIVINKTIISLAKNMKNTMMEQDGLGLAGPQVGINKRIFVFLFDIENFIKKTSNNKKIIACINPKIIFKSKEKNQSKEGCLSLPNLQKNISRFNEILLTFTNEKKKELKLKLKGLNARIVQHEIDHLDGILISDY